MMCNIPELITAHILLSWLIVNRILLGINLIDEIQLLVVLVLVRAVGHVVRSEEVGLK